MGSASMEGIAQALTSLQPPCSTPCIHISAPCWTSVRWRRRATREEALGAAAAAAIVAMRDKWRERPVVQFILLTDVTGVTDTSEVLPLAASMRDRILPSDTVGVYTARNTTGDTTGDNNGDNNGDITVGITTARDSSVDNSVGERRKDSKASGEAVKDHMHGDEFDFTGESSRCLITHEGGAGPTRDSSDGGGERRKESNASVEAGSGDHKLGEDCNLTGKKIRCLPPKCENDSNSAVFSKEHGESQVDSFCIEHANEGCVFEYLAIERPATEHFQRPVIKGVLNWPRLRNQTSKMAEATDTNFQLPVEE